MNCFLAPLYYLWKLYIGLVFVITLLLFYPLLFVILQFEQLKPLSFKVNVVWSRCIRIFCFYAIEITGNTNIQKEPCVIVGNHTSYLDIFLLYSFLPKNRFLFMGKSELLGYPFVKTFFKRLNIPVDRNNAMKSGRAFIKARQELNEGWSIALFPEGGIMDPTSKLFPFKDGAFQLAKSSKSDIVPMTFMNNFRLFSDPVYMLYPAMPGLDKVHIHNTIKKEEVIQSDIETLKNKTHRLINAYLPQE